MSSLHFRLNLTARAVTGLAAAAVAMPVLLAPGSAAAMEEIVSTARGRAESLQDVPAAVSVISADTIEQKGIQRVEDFVNLVPGMTIVNSAEVADTQVNIRGINGARDAEVNYALIVDGILMTNPAALNREWSNISQVEVLKGPQGALYGRNAAAGAIIITTKKPEKALDADVRASLAEDDTYTLNGSVGGVVNNDTLTWQVNGDFRTTNGFYEDVFNNKDDVIDNAENWSLGGRLIWSPSDKLNVDTKFRYGEVDAASITFNSVFHIPDLTVAGPAFAENVNDHEFQFNPNVESFNNQEATEFSVKVDYDLGWADLIGWGLYSDIQNNLGADGTSGAFYFFATDQACIDSTTEIANSGFQLAPPQFLVPGDPFSSVYGAYTPTTCDGTQYQERNQKDYSFEVRLRSKGDQRLRWEGGLYYLNIDREVGVNLGIDTGNGVIVPELYTSNPVNPTEQLVHDNFDSDVYAIFGQLAYDIVDNVEVSLALRYDREERSVTNLVPTGPVTQYLTCTGAPFTGGDPINPGLCLDPTGASGDKSKDFDQFQPKLAVSWDVTDSLTAFASVGVGFKSGGFNNFGSAATVDLLINQPLDLGGTGGINENFPAIGIDDEFREETSTSWEVGFKSDIGDRFRWEGAAYYMDVEDMQFFEFFVGQFGLLRVVSNIDEVNITGIELSAAWQATDWMSLYANGNVLDSEIDKITARPDTVGNKSPYTPDYTFSLGGNFIWPLTPGLDLIADIGITGVGETWFHVVQDQQRPTIFQGFFGFDNRGDYSINQRDAYQLLNLRLGLAGENWSVVAFGNNVTDEDYLEEVIPAPEFGGSFIHPGARSRYGVEVSYRF